MLHLALLTHPGHDLWLRDFVGASGVFSVVLPEAAEAHLETALDALKVFAIGASWGGTRSLVAPMGIRKSRVGKHPRNQRIILRFSIGMEDPADLWDDL